MSRGPVGTVTRGTTAARRLRRADRWLRAAHPALLRRPGLVVVDLGFGDRPATTLELARMVRGGNPTARVIGLDIDPDRVAAARPAAGNGVSFAVGGFELAGFRPHLVRAFNVLRQYAEADVAAAWQRMQAQLAPDGLIVEGTCDETGVLGAWVSLDATCPQALTLALDPARHPGAVAARLPKSLIHRNVPGDPVHRLLAELDQAWERHAGLRVFGARQRLAATVRDVRALGWPLVDGPSRWRRGELSVAWRALEGCPR